MLYLDVKVNETWRIGDITVTLIQKSGQLARLSINAEKDKKIHKIEKGSTLHVRENDIITPE